MATINYTDEINSFTGCFQTINATEYEAVCKIKKECYECIPDDRPIKLYFDIDVGGLAAEYDNDLIAAPFIRDIAKDILTEFCNDICKIQPEFHISSSHTEKCEDDKGVEKWKISFHLNINNITALKSDQKILNKKLNEYAHKKRPDLIDYIGIDDKKKPNKLFDDTVYDKNRKMRSVHCSKKGQNRYLKIEEGSFEGSVIGAFIPENAILYKEPVVEEIMKPKSVTQKIDGLNNYNKIYFETFLEKGALNEYSSKYDKWRDIGFILFNEFGRTDGFELFDEFSKLCREKYDFHKNHEWWDKLQDKPDKPVLFGTLIKWVKADNKDIYLEVLNHIKQMKKEKKSDDFVSEGNPEPKIKRFEEDLVEFEKYHCLIVNKASYIKTRFDTGDYLLMSRCELMTAYANMYFEEHKGDKIVKSSFIQNWVSCNHPNIRKYDDVDIYPNNSKCPDNIFNLWVPFEMEKKTELYTPNKEGLDFILNHILILCGNEEPVYDYFVLWIAQMIQFPEIKTIMPTLVSKEGSGKGTLMKLFRRMLGNSKILETTNPSRDVWGDFNGIMTNTFLVNLNELSKKDTKDDNNKIKGLITDLTIDINLKGKNQFTVKSFHRFIATTNNEDPIKTTDGDRRNLIIRSSDEKKGNIEYFNKINKFLDDDIVVRTCYDYFKNLKGADKFGEIKMPDTEYQLNIKSKNVPAPEQWLESFVRLNSNETTIELLGRDIYDKFIIWTLKNGIEYKASAISLGLFFKNRKIDGITKGRHTKRGEMTELNIPKLKKYFNIGCLIDLDV